MLHFIFGRAGFGKTHYIEQLLLAQGSRQQAVLLVPEQFSFETERSMVALDLAHHVEVMSFSRLSDRVFKQYGGIAGKRLSDQEKLLLMHRGILQVGDRLQLYRRGHKNIRFATHVLSIATECEYKGITPEQMITVSITLPDGGLKQKLQEIALMLSAYHSLIQNAYIDPTEEAERLYRLLQEVPFWKGKRVYIDGFKDFTAPQKKLVSQMIGQADEVYVTLCTDGRPAAHSLTLFANTADLAKQLTHMAESQGVAVDQPVILTRNHRSATDGIRALEQSFHKTETLAGSGDHSVMICPCDDIYDEADFVAASIRRLVQEEGLRYRQITVITREPERYVKVLEAAFDRFSIPYFSDRRREVTYLPLFSLLVKGMELAENGCQTATLLSLMKTGLWDLTLSQIAKLENYAYVWSVDGAGWLKEFTQHPLGMGDKRPDEEEMKELNRLRKRAVMPLVEFRTRWKTCGTVIDFCRAVYSFLEDNAIYERLGGFVDRLTGQGEGFQGEDMIRSFELCNQLLDKMVSAMGETQVSGQEFIQLMTLMIRSADLGKIPQGIDQVVIGSADRTRPASPYGVFVVGANQGVFPAVPASSGLLSDFERKLLNEQQLPFSDHCEFETVEEDFLFYQAACSASHKVCFTYTTTGNETGEPCRWLLDIKQALPNLMWRSSDQWREEDPLLFAGAQLPAFDLLAQQYWQEGAVADSLYQYISQQQPQRMALLEQLTMPRDCSIRSENAVGLFGKQMKVSPTAVEAYHKCRFSYFCKYGMRVRPLRPVGLDVMAKGTLVHHVLEKIIGTYGSSGLHQLSADEMRDTIHRLIMEFVESDMGGLADKNHVFVFQLQRLEVLLESLLSHMAEEMKDSQFETAACELPIGPGETVESLRIPLSGGGEVTVVGVLDRLDIYQKDGDTYFRVVDYKTGTKEFHLEDIYHGIGLQMFIYLYAIQQNGQVFGESRYPAGVLYMPAKRSSVMSTDRAEVQKQLADRLRMKGLVLDDMDVVRAMEPEVSGTYIPVTLKLNGDPSEKSALASMEFFGRTERHIRQLLQEMGEGLLQGKITCDPLDSKSTKDNACVYCDYKAACPLLGQSPHRRVAGLSVAQKKDLLKGGEWCGDELHAGATDGH